MGEPVAIVIADNRYIAEDAAALVDVDYNPLPAIADCRAALHRTQRLHMVMDPTIPPSSISVMAMTAHLSAACL